MLIRTRLIVYLIKGKWLNFYFNAFCFFRIRFWKGQHDPFLTKIDKISFVFKESCCLWVFSPRIWNVLSMCFSLKNLLRHFKKKMEKDPEITKKLFFLFYFWVENMRSPNIRDCPLNNSLNPRCLSMPYGSMVSRLFYKDHRRDVLVRIQSNYFLYLKIFKK